MRCWHAGLQAWPRQMLRQLAVHFAGLIYKLLSIAQVHIRTLKLPM